MQIQTRPNLFHVHNTGNGPQKPEPPKNDEPQDGYEKKDWNIGGKLATAAVFGACGALGYAGSVAHSIPFVGPAVSGVAGAIVGASAGASLATATKGQNVKLGALVGAVGGAIVGASYGGTTFGNVAMGVAGATMPYGLLVGIFSGVE